MTVALPIEGAPETVAGAAPEEGGGATVEEIPAAGPWLRAYLATLGGVVLVILAGIHAGALALALVLLGAPATVPEEPPDMTWFVLAWIGLVLVIVGAEQVLNGAARRLPGGLRGGA